MKRSLTHFRTIAVAAIGLAAATVAEAAEVKNVVLYDILTGKGYKVAVVQNPATTLADDVAATDRVIARMGGPVILVGHSYGGTVITEAGDNPNVAALVYIAAFAPDAGESTFGLIPKEGPQPPIEFTEDQFGFLNRDAFLGAFAPDVEKGMLEFMADSQVPPSLAAGTAPVSAPAWKSKPSWYLVAKDDHIIPPDAQRLMAKRAGATVSETDGSHVAYITRPEAAAAVIEAAAAPVSE
ncbi:MAG TPA: alpha/beta hydrolase [Bauldia sp.]|nr:alpha/beta hydrolase [Bauldia sp.]